MHTNRIFHSNKIKNSISSFTPRISSQTFLNSTQSNFEKQLFRKISNHLAMTKRDRVLSSLEFPTIHTQSSATFVISRRHDPSYLRTRRTANYMRAGNYAASSGARVRFPAGKHRRRIRWPDTPARRRSETPQPPKVAPDSSAPRKIVNYAEDARLYRAARSRTHEYELSGLSIFRGAPKSSRAE